MYDKIYDIPLNDWGGDNTPYVTIDEMKKLVEDLKRKYHYDFSGLKLDKKSGLYYTDYFENISSSIVYDHLLVEQMMEMREKVDWARVTFGYTPEIVRALEEIYQNPLVWIEGDTFELEDSYVVRGRVAKPMSSEERATCSPDDTFFIHMLGSSRVLWFADNLPTSKTKLPGTEFIRWDSIMDSPYSSDFMDDIAGPKMFNVREFRSNIDYIAQERGGAKAAQIIRHFREDWSDIVALKLFGIDKLNDKQREDFRLALFEGMDRALRHWDAEQSKTMVNTNKNNITPHELSSETLENTFSFVFRKTDNFRRMIDFLLQESTLASDGDWARYALAIYQANIFVHRPKTFKNWLPCFCELFGRSVPYQDPNKLKRTKCDKSIEAYLPTS